MPPERLGLNNVLIRFVAAAVLALSWVLAWEMVLYAGELPGEGFAASVLALLALLLQYVVMGQQEASRRLPLRWFHRGLLLGVALLLALVSVPLTWGAPLLTVFKLPVAGTVVSSTTFFDVALFLVVTGAMVEALGNLEEPKG